MKTTACLPKFYPLMHLLYPSPQPKRPKVAKLISFVTVVTVLGIIGSSSVASSTFASRTHA